MKRNVFVKVAVLVLTLVMLLPLALSTSAKAAVSGEYSISDAIYRTTHSGRTPKEQAEYDTYARSVKMEETISRMNDFAKSKIKEHQTKERVEKMAACVDQLRAQIPWIVDAANGGDFSVKACADAVINSVSSIVALCGPYGALASSVINLGNDIFKAIMGGAAETSELVQMEDRLTQQLDEIQDQLYGIEEGINDLSNQINEQTNEIIAGVTTAIDNAVAKQALNDFMLTSGKYDFGYNQYRNYIYGELTGNSAANTAYYALLKKAQLEGASDATVKAYYDQLYTALMDNWGVYRENIMGTAEAKPIVQAYYDVVCARPDLMEAGETSAEYEALMFAYDLYQTELMANQLILACNLYQYAQMCVTGEETYTYDSYNGGMISFAQANGGIAEQISARITEIETQLVRDIAYILKLDAFYIVADAKGDLREVANNDPDTYGNVLRGETVYLTPMPETVCEIFGFEADDFTYETSVPETLDGIFFVCDGTDRITASLCYRGEELSKITFFIDVANEYSGGSGTASDPYLIINKEQFLTIGNGLDKHYRLMRDIDLGGETIAPFGESRNEGGTYTYVPFTGSLDGNGYKVENLTILGHDKAGLFGENAGEIADLTLYNVKVSSTVNEAKKSSSQFFAGAFAGINSGVIKYCNLESDGTDVDVTGGKAPASGVSFSLNNAVTNRCIDVYVGGIAGANGNVIAYCRLANVHVSATSTHDLAGDEEDTNKNHVYVGGVCGYNYGIGSLGYCSVKASVKLSSHAKTICNANDWSLKPYITAFAGGITAKTDSPESIAKMKSEVTVLYNETEIVKESGYGAREDNVFCKKDAYVPNLDEEEVIPMQTVEDVDARIDGATDKYTVTHTYSNDIYETGTASFNTENLKLFVNGNEVTYKVVAIYGFDTKNNTVTNTSETVYLLFSTEIDSYTVYLMEEIPITVKGKRLESREVLYVKDSYHPGEFDDCLTGLVLQYNYSYGEPERVAITEANLSQIRVLGDINTFGTHDIALSYNDGEIFTLTIRVVCSHSDDYTTWGDAPTEIVEPTCTELGYAAFTCPECGYVKKLYAAKREHTPDKDHRVGGWEATCQNEGNTGRVLCLDCGTVLQDGLTIPKKNHAYTYLDADKHICSVGSHTEHHHYTVTESVQLVTNPDGSKSYCVVYTQTCVCRTEEGKFYTRDIVDRTTDVSENADLPTVMVSNGFVLSGGDEVAVYVQLLNNPGIKGANFGIRYPEGLTLLRVEDGTVFAGSLVADGNDVGYGYNFLRGDSETVTANGNLLKLVFRVDDGAVLGDSFEVKVVYAIGNGASGGFSTANGKQYFVTKAGMIKVVGHLPGDVNDDGVVDLMDAIEIGRFLVDKGSVNENYANVDLSTPENPGESAVDVDDVVAILQYIIGGYGTNLLTSDFEITLNTNGADEIVLNDLLVDICNEENDTYEEVGLPQNLARDGYKFLGWFDRMYGGNRITGGAVNYNDAQKVGQTLYAQWELNKLVFDPNGATHGEMEDVYYSEDGVLPVVNAYEKKYAVAFVDEDNNRRDTSHRLIYSLEGFRGSNGKFYANLNDAVADLVNEHYGTLTLSAVWGTLSLEYPDWNVNGYDPVAWFVNGIHEIVPGENDADIYASPEADRRGDFYYVYAEYTPIEYTMIVDFNGGHGDVADCSDEDPNTVYGVSVKNKYALGNIGAENTGRTLTCWHVYVFAADGVTKVYDKPYTKLSTLGYIPGVTQGAVVHVVAQWDVDTYNITYSSGEGEAVAPDSYTIDNIETVTTGNPKHKTYPDCVAFEGWYMDSAFARPFNAAERTALKNDPKNITLYAKWSSYKAYSDYNHTDLRGENVIVNGEGRRIILDLRAYTETQNLNKTITFKNCAGVYILGKSGTTYQNLQIYMEATDNNYKNQVLHLNNFKMTGCVAKAGSVPVNLDLECRGTSEIVATSGKIAINGFDDLEIKGNGNLTVKGANGANATTAGAAGENGYVAIKVSSLKLNVTGKLTVKGGNGGNGADGKVGGNGSTNNSTTLLYESHNGLFGAHIQTIEQYNQAYSGEKGGTGGKGGNGSKPIEYATIENSGTGTVSLIFGDGGDGGKGGKGGDGGKGHDYYGETSGVSFIYACNPGQGGNAGYGGDGGKGGESVLVAYSFDRVNDNVEVRAGRNGDCGLGGDPGSVGIGGNGGSNDAGWGNKHSAGKAANGNPGSRGLSGDEWEEPAWKW